MTPSRPVHRAALSCALLAVAYLASPSEARVFLTVDEALDLAFPACTVERGTVYLDEAEKDRIAELAGSDFETAIVHPYTARCPEDRGLDGTAYFDAHRVRTLPETVMVVVSRDGEVRRVEVLSFDEPPDYVPSDAWYAQFEGRDLGPELELDRDIRPVTGASLTARATTDAVRRVLAVHRTLRDRTEAVAGEEGR